MQEILKEDGNINEFDSHISESSGLTEWELGNDNDLNNVRYLQQCFSINILHEECINFSVDHMDHCRGCRGREQRVPQPGDGCEVRGNTEQGPEEGSEDARREPAGAGDHGYHQ